MEGRGCGHSNRPGRLFCAECGALLALRCHACQAENQHDDKFCGQCGAPLAGAPAAVSEAKPVSYTPRHLAEEILTSRGALEGERKQVTVIFADVKGSMELQGDIDPEEWHKIMDRFFQIMADGVHRFEGTLNQFTGDGVMALFGAPIAHEDHAPRACYAALYVRAELRHYADELRIQRGLNFSVRMGLNSGEVVVGKIGDDVRADYTAQGHTVGIAARMEQIAEPGCIYASEHTARLVSGYFQLRDLGETKIKGVNKPLHVLEVEGVGELRTRLDLSRTRGFSRFVGREREEQALEAALGQASEGKGRIVGVVGEAGIGKSRLCHEFVEKVRARGIAVYAAHCPSYGKALPFLPVLELLREYFSISERDTSQVAREKIAGRLLLLDEQFRDVLPFVWEFLGIPDPQHPVPRIDPDLRQRRLFAFTRQLVQTNAREPAVFLLDDLHWIDSGSEAFLAQVVEASSETRNLVVANFRPDYRAAWMERSLYQRLPLESLGSKAMQELLSDLLGDDGSLLTLRDRICERSGGNPFFVEEIVRSLVDDGTLVGTRGAYRLPQSMEQVRLPPTLKAVLDARIDRLAEPEKYVLQTASVIGREFSALILQHVVETLEPPYAALLPSALRRLSTAEFIYEAALYPQIEYAFKHPLTQEAAYEKQVGDQRTRVHSAIASKLADLFGDSPDEHAALIAHHWDRAGRAPEAALWHRHAATWVGLRGPLEALPHWRRVYHLLKDAESSESLSFRLEACAEMLNLECRLGASEDEIAALFGEGCQLAEQKDDQRALAVLTARYATALGFVFGEIEGWVQYSRKALTVASGLGDTGLELGVSVSLQGALFYRGRLEEALEVNERALAQSPTSPNVGADVAGLSPYPFTVGFHGLILTHMGRPAEGARELEKAMKATTDEPELSALMRGWMCDATYYCGDLDSAVRNARSYVDSAEKLGTPLFRVLAYMYLGQSLVPQREWNDAVAALEFASGIITDTGVGLSDQAFVLACLAEAYSGRGDTELARATAATAIERAIATRSELSELIGQIAFTRVLLRVDGLKAERDIETSLERAMSLIRTTGARSYEPFVYQEKAFLAGLRQDATSRECELQRARELFLKMGAAGWVNRLDQMVRPPQLTTTGDIGGSSAG